MAAAKIKSNSILSAFSGPGVFLILYIIYKIGGDVMWMQYLGLLTLSLFGFAIKPYLLVHDVKGYAYKDFWPCIWNCIKVTFLSVLLSYLTYILLGNSSILSSIVLFATSLFSVVLSSLLFMDRLMRRKLVNAALNMIKTKINRK